MEGIITLSDIIFLLIVFAAAVLYITFRLIVDKFTVYIDMDGVLAQWNTWATLEDTYKPGYFLNCIPQENLIRAVKLLQIFGIRVCILSAVCNEQAAKEKSLWLDRYVGRFVQRIFVPYGTNKADYVGAGRNSLLIDDFSVNLHQWSATGNTGVKFYNGINGTKGTWTGLSISHEMSSVILAFRIFCSLRQCD